MELNKRLGAVGGMLRSKVILLSKFKSFLVALTEAMQSIMSSKKGFILFFAISRCRGMPESTKKSGKDSDCNFLRFLKTCSVINGING